MKSDPPAEDATLDDLRQSWMGFFKKKLFFSFWRCSNCQLLYSQAYFTQQMLSSLYGAMPENMSDVPVAALAKTQRGYFELFQRYAPQRGNYLEIGPDAGLFLQNCLERSHYRKYYLFEPNKTVHEALYKRLERHEVEINSSLADFSAVPDRSIDAVSAIHVLDHLADPVAFLKSLHTKLKPDAVMVIVTHDERSLLARVFGPAWPAYCLQHPQLFNSHSIARLLEAAGYQPLRVEKSWNYFPVSFLADHLSYAIGLGRKLPLSALGRVQLPLKLGNIITLARA